MRSAVAKLLLFVYLSLGEAFLGHSHRQSSFHRRTTSPSSSESIRNNNKKHSTVGATTLKEPSAVASTPPTRKTTIISNDDEFLKPEPDKRQYRAVRLWNGLECLLVSSPESDVEACSVHVKAGHMDDPDDRPGLAHFHEHMLFLGTQKYPSENEYEAYLSQNGGSSNAYTDMEDTNYYFSITPFQQQEQQQGEGGDTNDETCEVDDEECNSSALEGALDRLAQFFVAPRFDRNMVDRELRAIDSEYRNSFTSDAWKNYQLLKASANPEHPFCKFGCGNYETLTQGGQIVNATHATSVKSLPIDDLLGFWNTYYRSYNMKVCVVGRSSLDVLQESMEKTFGQLPHSSGTPRHGNLLPDQVFQLEHAQYNQVPAFGKDQLGKIRHVIPLIETRCIKVYFATPPLSDPLLKQSRPFRVLSHLLGHESPGSLHAELNGQGLLNGLTSGFAIDSSDFSLFSLTLHLTPEGMKRREYVLDLVFDWIALIRDVVNDSGNKMKLFHDELCQISDMNFRFRENGDPTSFCSSVAELLFDYPPNIILRGSSKTGEYDPEVAKMFLDRIRPSNAFITIVNSDFSEEGEWLKERWYGAVFQEVDMSQEQIDRWDSATAEGSALRLPELNAYIPTDFSLRCDDEEGTDDGGTTPKILVDRPDLRLWHKMDSKWRVPKTFIQVALTSPNLYRSPRTMTLNRIFERILNDDLNSFVYDANLAGCSYKVACSPTGFRLALKGYSEKLSFLFETLTSRIFSLIDELKEGPDNNPGLALKFRKAKESLLRETKNYRKDAPYDVAAYNMRLMLEEKVWYVTDYVDEMEGNYEDRDPVTMAECAAVASECLSGRIRAEANCYGNIDEASALHLAEVIDNRFLKPSRPLRDIELPTLRAMIIPTVAEAVNIFGPTVDRPVPLVYQELVFNESEENNAIELHLQVGCDSSLGYRGVAILDLISHLAYNSAYNQLRTQEQLGYIVSAYAKKMTGGSWGLSVIVQSSVASPTVLEARSLAWLQMFRGELAAMSEEILATEASSVVAQLLERDTKLSQEVVRAWGEILLTETLPQSMRTPAFNRVQRIAQELLVGSGSIRSLKEDMLSFFDKYLSEQSSERRVISARVYNRAGTEEYNQNVGKPGIVSSYEEIQGIKHHLGTWPITPYWSGNR